MHSSDLYHIQHQSDTASNSRRMIRLYHFLGRDHTSTLRLFRRHQDRQRLVSLCSSPKTNTTPRQLANSPSLDRYPPVLRLSARVADEGNRDRDQEEVRYLLASSCHKRQAACNRERKPHGRLLRPRQVYQLAVMQQTDRKHSTLSIR